MKNLLLSTVALSMGFAVSGGGMSFAADDDSFGLEEIVCDPPVKYLKVCRMCRFPYLWCLRQC